MHKGENFMRKFFFVMLFLTCSFAYAEEGIKPAVVQSAAVSQNIMFENCSKIYGINQEKLFYLTLTAISANKFNIDEIQTANGYIIFTANRNKYLATIAKIDNTNSIIKITPCNNIYNFPPGILTNTFKYIDLNLNVEIKS